MSYVCSGRKDGNAPCRMKVSHQGAFCRHHENQRPKNTCACYLDTGSRCSFPATETGFCEFHPETTKCQGKTITGGKCLLSIASGAYCWNCKNQETVANSKSSLEKCRAIFSNSMGPIVPFKVPSTFTVIAKSPAELDIPAQLRKINLEKPEDCCICMDAMEGKNTYRRLGCGHFVHVDCISKCLKMECPMCRAVIESKFLPSWAVERIKDNIQRAQKDKEQQNAIAAAMIALEEGDTNIDPGIMRAAARGILDMNSSEEEDFNSHVNNGTPMQLIETRDHNGNLRFALEVVRSNSNN